MEGQKNDLHAFCKGKIDVVSGWVIDESSIFLD